ncbi:MAG: DnaT-like ssDNA-binding protein [Pseudomonadota bacterium]
MAITLIVEDGTGVTDANSYVDVDYARAFAESIGLILSIEDEVVKANLLLAMPYIENQQYQGHKTSPDQLLQWPRSNVIALNFLIDDDYMPTPLKKAQVMAAYLVENGTELFPVITAQLVTEETVGPITTKYSDQYVSTYTGLPAFSEVDVYLKPFCNYAGGYRLSPAFGF